MGTKVNVTLKNKNVNGETEKNSTKNILLKFLLFSNRVILFRILLHGTTDMRTVFL
jgi:hypothetical protein